MTQFKEGSVLAISLLAQNNLSASKSAQGLPPFLFLSRICLLPLSPFLCCLFLSVSDFLSVNQRLKPNIAQIQVSRSPPGEPLRSPGAPFLRKWCFTSTFRGRPVSICSLLPRPSSFFCPSNQSSPTYSFNPWQ